MGAAIETRGLQKHYGTLRAVDGVDLEIEAGECFGILGPNGAGKTTLVEMLEGIRPPTAGSVSLLGRDWKSANMELRQQIGIALQETQFADRLTVLETVRLFRSFYQAGVDPEVLITSVGLAEKRDVWVVKLSGGQRQRVAMACALVGDPQILFLDEPTTGVDPRARRALWDRIAAYRDRGRTVVLTTHYMEEAEQLCQRVAIMDRGRIIATGTPQELIQEIPGQEVIEFHATPDPAPGTLEALPGVVAAERRGGRWRLQVHAVHETAPVLIDSLRSASIRMSGLGTRRISLEDLFLSLTGRNLEEDT